MENLKIKPFLKWAGGKSQLLTNIRLKYPKQITSYCEPFVGGGAVLFDILSLKQPEFILINDINYELINTYRQVQKNIKNLIRELAEIQETYWQFSHEERKKYYYAKRQRFNQLKNKTGNELEQAVLFIFLNKTCFNGLYRVNKQGLFNVPMGSYKKPIICDRENLQLVSNLLQGVTIQCGDFCQCLDFIQENTFVYLDPPYRPLNDTASFTAYDKKVFDDREQIRLQQFINQISNIGAKIILSNSDPKNYNKNDNFFDNLYQEYTIQRIPAKRMINCNGANRGNVSELLICNY
ncbi:MAG: DNA adenine methylase [Oscillospiraceae bacterium]|nr:DNA adenine methylase [Oscillospiraceae bacterium]